LGLADVIRAFVRFCRWLPAAMDRSHLRWALSEMDPMHPDLPLIVARINELEKS
jgi:hypothetical protein